ncbi:MAG TPA: class I SAM-dependent methyltransferase [Croceibacterium sp.]|nr:class I SAM-dependent methyltransferase [Croceibacterium sp.]
MTAIPASLERFREDYAAYRASEGRAYLGQALQSLPYLAEGPLKAQWAVRARSFETLVARVVVPLANRLGRHLDVLDLGAGNGWLSYRLACAGHRCTAIDVRNDHVDGLGAAEELAEIQRFERLTASFDSLPLPTGTADLAVYNASLHYASDLSATLAEARRCIRAGGVLAVADSPFYRHRADGEAMVTEKRGQGGLAALDCIEFLTRASLERESSLAWRRLRVRYPLWYELRPVRAWLTGRRRPSRFDVWLATMP